jgi:hypothetical protein
MTSNTWHPSAPEVVGNTGPRGDYTDVWRFSCCGMQVASDTPPARSPGCRAMPADQPSVNLGRALPFTRFVGQLKQVRSSDLDPVQRLALAFGFPLFLGRHPFGASPGNEGLDNLLRSIDPTAREGSFSFCRRRYSGDASEEFPRSRYYHAIPSEFPDDTIACELNAYTIPALLGYTRATSSPDGKSVDLIFRGLPGEPNPLGFGVANPDAYDHVFGSLHADPLREAASRHDLKTVIPLANKFTVPVGLTTSHHEIERCIDLRRPETRRWLVEFFRDPPSGLHGDALRVLASAHRIDLGDIRDWSSLIPIIYAQTVGGNPLTDMVGTYLRAEGCDALIFPSARADTMVHWSDGELKMFAGWNLVDYRGAKKPGKVGIDVGDPIERLPGAHELIEPSTGPDAGSLLFRGPKSVNRMINQLQYERYLLAHGSSWRLKHAQEVLLEQGYFWYEKAYGLSLQRFSAVCHSCRARFDDPKVESLEECPRCRYRG